jgi:AcrR family transcriptional regulator
MARKSKRSTSVSTTSDQDQSARGKIIAAFMELLATHPIEEIGFANIASRAEVSLSEMRGEFGSTVAILAAHIKEVDRQVLAAGDADMAEEPARERLFDVLMRRLEVLAPHKEAVRSLVRSAGRNPGLAFALNGMAVRSQQWMLTAADIGANGPKGMLRAQGLALLYSRVLRVWVNDEDPGLARTMAALDRELGRGQRWSGILDEACKIPERLCRGRDRWRSRMRRDDTGAGDEPIAA